jgi:protein ImuB
MIAERTMVLSVADWPVVAAGIAPDQPAVVVDGNRVVSVSAAARAAGVRAGLRRREAQARCPEVLIVPADSARDAREFEPVVAAISEICPRLEVSDPGRCAVPTRGPSRYFGGDHRLARLVRETVQGVVGDGGWVRVGVADSRFAAQMATTDLAGRDGDRIRDGIGDGIVVVPAGESPGWLAGFPIAVLAGAEGVSAGLVDLFARLGLSTLGAVAELPGGDVVARFGPEGVTAHRLAAGLDDRPARLSTSGPDLAVEARFEVPLERVDTAAFAARGLAEELHAQLVAAGLTCALLLVVAETEHGERLERRWRRTAMTAGAVVERVRWQLDGWLNGPPAVRPTAGITLLRLVPEEVVPAGGTQLRLWGTTAVAPDRVIRAVARLEGMLGPDAVMMAEWRGGRHPDDQVVLVPAGTVDLAGERTGASPPVGVSDPDRPAWPGHLPSPSPATVLPGADRPEVEVFDPAGAPVQVNSRAVPATVPVAVSIGGGRRTRVAGWAGPWPVTEHWWDPASRRRQARFQFVLDDGHAYLVVLERGRWMLAATYD